MFDFLIKRFQYNIKNGKEAFSFSHLTQNMIMSLHQIFQNKTNLFNTLTNSSNLKLTYIHLIGG